MLLLDSMQRSEIHLLCYSGKKPPKKNTTGSVVGLLNLSMWPLPRTHGSIRPGLGKRVHKTTGGSASNGRVRAISGKRVPARNPCLGFRHRRVKKQGEATMENHKSRAKANGKHNGRKAGTPSFAQQPLCLAPSASHALASFAKTTSA